jgi:YidC/Oxa1 family membrane protein insertase
MMEWIYWSISWILLRWHDVWAVLLPGGGWFLGTSWEWVLAIVFLVITIRILLFPIFVKQIRSQRAMQALQPKMKALQEKHKGDQQTLREEMMKLYQSEKVNPLMGCLPMFLQIPVFLGLFHVLKHINPLHNGGATLYGWTQSEFNSAADAKLFGAPIPMAFKSSALDVNAVGGGTTTVKVVAALLVIIMMFTTFMTSRQMILKTGWATDPQQKMVQRLMLYGIPISLLLSGWAFPIGVIIYWVTQNIFSFGQQFWVLHKYPPPVTAGSTVPAIRRTPATATREDAVDTVGKPRRFSKVSLASMRTALANVISARTSPGKASGPAKAGPTRVVASKPAPGAVPIRPSPTKATPPVPAKAASAKAAPLKATQAKPVPTKAAANRPGPVKAGKAAPPAVPPAQDRELATSGVASEPSQNGRSSDAGDGSMRGESGQAATGKAVPAKAVPAKAVPAKAVPAKAVPAKASPRSAPTKGGAGRAQSGSAAGAQAGRRPVNQVGEKSGVFGRQPDDGVTAAPVAEQRSSAPKPGAKPNNPKKGGPRRRGGR